ncbi:MAG: hypothetical protein WDZ28_05780 [Simkaniaceae bacterium]
MRWLLALFALPLFSLEQQPYFGQQWEFYLTPSYQYRYYPAVQNARNPSHYSSHDHTLGLNLQVSFWPRWDLQLEADFAATSKTPFGMQSIAADLRYLFFDDVQGDPVSLTLGTIIRVVPYHFQKDPSTPYHATTNIEVGTAIGKEVDHLDYWVVRGWGYLGLGIGNRGAPWLNSELAFEGNRENHHHFRAFAKGYMGMGGIHTVNISHLRGYANIYHRSIDLGGRYTYLFDIWGRASLEYAYRLYARAYPKCAHTFVFRYTLPFSVL